MRHIQIKLSLILVMILLSVSGYGQIQQVLKNGFVAATDSGVYYLQDGFNEWVRLGIPSKVDIAANAFETMDTISGVGNYSVSSFSYSVEINEGFPQQYHFDGAFFGNKLFSSLQTGGGYSQGYFTPKNIIDFDKFGKGQIAYHHGSGDFGRYVIINSDGNHTYRIYGTWVNYISGFSIDNDTTVVFVGENNTIYKLLAAKLEANYTNTYISGLHSRLTDSHQICYNSNNDEFIIVSDSGIVYSYNKTSITTLDTIWSINGGHLTGVYDLVYDNIFDRYYISFLDSNGLYDVQSFTTPIDAINGNTNIISPSNPYSLSINSKGDILALSKNICYKINRDHGGAIEIKNIGGDIVVFDLDYINYIP